MLPIQEPKALWSILNCARAARDLRDLKYDQEYREREGRWANYKSQYGVAYDYYKQKGSKFLAESKLEFGVFALLSGRWEIDNRDEDVKTKVVNLRGAVGFLAKYSFSWTWAFTLGSVPAYVCLTLGVSAGVAIGLELGFSWVNGKFQNWKLRVIKDITISVRFSFTAQVGVGIKGFAEIWVKFTAALDLKIMLLIWGGGPNSVTVSYGLDFSVGATIFWITISKTWTIAQGIMAYSLPT